MCSSDLLLGGYVGRVQELVGLRGQTGFHLHQNTEASDLLLAWGFRNNNPKGRPRRLCHRVTLLRSALHTALRTLDGIGRRQALAQRLGNLQALASRSFHTCVFPLGYVLLLGRT